ncbi:hypothetical protein TCAL_13996, partial [Tigriopus californicus]|eukprot:TCALIF_13996-PA protein Name:"Protein of unknown function" AED:0.30 eAED:0.30 QI:0/0.5/0/1/1/0.66/3/0/364
MLDAESGRKNLRSKPWNVPSVKLSPLSIKTNSSHPSTTEKLPSFLEREQQISEQQQQQQQQQQHLSGPRRNFFSRVGNNELCNEIYQLYSQHGPQRDTMIKERRGSLLPREESRERKSSRCRKSLEEETELSGEDSNSYLTETSVQMRKDNSLKTSSRATTNDLTFDSAVPAITSTASSGGALALAVASSSLQTRDQISQKSKATRFLPDEQSRAVARVDRSGSSCSSSSDFMAWSSEATEDDEDGEGEAEVDEANAAHYHAHSQRQEAIVLDGEPIQDEVPRLSGHERSNLRRGQRYDGLERGRGGERTIFNDSGDEMETDGGSEGKHHHPDNNRGADEALQMCWTSRDIRSTRSQGKMEPAY